MILYVVCVNGLMNVAGFGGGVSGGLVLSRSIGRSVCLSIDRLILCC